MRVTWQRAVALVKHLMQAAAKRGTVVAGAHRGQDCPHTAPSRWGT